MKLIYICSPSKGEPEKNIAKANKYVREEATKSSCAITSHRVFTRFLNGEVPDERWLKQEVRKALLCRCDEFLVCGSIISGGMHEEIKIAYKNGITILGRDLSVADVEDVVSGETKQCCKMV